MVVDFPWTSTATAAGTTTLTKTSNNTQIFTGSTTQTCVLPVASGLLLGIKFRIYNQSTGAVTVQSSGANTILVLPGNTAAEFMCILLSGTTAASWQVSLIPFVGQMVGIQDSTTIGASCIEEMFGLISRLKSNATSLTTGTVVNVCTTVKITLGPGNYEIIPRVGFIPGASTLVNNLNFAISKTSATLPATDTIAVPTAGECYNTQGFPATAFGAVDYVMEMTPVPVSIAAGASQDYYLVASSSFSVSTMSVYGSMFAKRRV